MKGWLCQFDCLKEPPGPLDAGQPGGDPIRDREDGFEALCHSEATPPVEPDRAATIRSKANCGLSGVHEETHLSYLRAVSRRSSFQSSMNVRRSRSHSVAGSFDQAILHGG